MRRRPRPSDQHPIALGLVAGLAAAMAATLQGCAGGGSTTSALSLPALPSLDPNKVSPPAADDGPVGSPTEIYSRIARGALGCWFGPAGGMKKSYVYYADADAPSRGGNALIVLHNRDDTQANPRGAKAYRVRITATPNQKTAVATERLRIAPEIADKLDADVRRWAHGEQGCLEQPTTAGWNADHDTTRPEKPPAGGSAQSKAKDKK